MAQQPLVASGIGPSAKHRQMMFDPDDVTCGGKHRRAGCTRQLAKPAHPI